MCTKCYCIILRVVILEEICEMINLFNPEVVLEEG